MALRPVDQNLVAEIAQRLGHLRARGARFLFFRQPQLCLPLGEGEPGRP